MHLFQSNFYRWMLEKEVAGASTHRFHVFQSKFYQWMLEKDFTLTRTHLSNVFGTNFFRLMSEEELISALTTYCMFFRVISSVGC